MTIPPFPYDFTGQNDEVLWRDYRMVRNQLEDCGGETINLSPVIRSLTKSAPPELALALRDAITDLFLAERVNQPLRRPDEVPNDRFDREQYWRELWVKSYFCTYRSDLARMLQQGIEAVFHHFTDIPGIGPSPIKAKLGSLLPNPAAVADGIYYTLDRLARESQVILFEKIWIALGGNRMGASNSDKKVTSAAESKLPNDQLAQAYFQFTVFEKLLNTPVPLQLTNEQRFTHCHLLGSPGKGKTSLLGTFVLHDIQSPDRPAIVAIDPHSALIRQVLEAELGVHDHITLIDPRDIEHPPSLNIFAVDEKRLNALGPAAREQVVNSVIETFDYLFSSLMPGGGAELTARQSSVFRNSAAVMMALPRTSRARSATILDLRDFMQNPAAYRDAINLLPDLQRSFFEVNFLDPKGGGYKDTCRQIGWRIDGILALPGMSRLLTSPENKLDLYQELEDRRIVLLDTAEDFLGKEGSSVFGKFFISLLYQAIFQRAPIPERERTPTFIYVDEAGNFFDARVGSLLQDARKFGCGVTLAHQHIGQAESGLANAIGANTGIRFAATDLASDAQFMARNMRTTADFILTQPRLHFATHIRDVTSEAISVPVTPGVLDRQPRLPKADFDAFIARNRKRVSLPPRSTLPMGTFAPGLDPFHRSPPVSPIVDEDISSEW